MGKTIAAIATPLAVGGIAVIRISGDEAISVADRVFKSKSGTPLSEKKGYSASFGAVFDNEKELDTSVATVFRAPKSYTGEDVVEISCHGGIYVVREVLRVVLKNGASLAEAGEFTKRAFLNGKMSLTQAEAVVDLINAKNAQAMNSAKNEYDGALFKSIQHITDELLNIAGHLSAWVDYPEEDIPVVSEENLKNSLSSAKKTMDRLIDNYDKGRMIREGIETAIVGKPNVGKSTLMNLISGYDKSIVTDIAGTTRDVVEELVNLGGITLKLSDTAGIHETEDEVEKFGVRLARERLDRASLVLAVFDSSLPFDEKDKEIINIAKGKNAIALINKTDLEQKLDAKPIEESFENVLFLSAKQSDSTEELEALIKKVVKLNSLDLSQGILSNERQRQCALQAQGYINESLEGLDFGMTLDAVTVSIEMAIDALLTLTGKKATEEVVNGVFSHFCVGK